VRVDYKAVSVTALLLAYADEMGDLMPDECCPSDSNHGSPVEPKPRLYGGLPIWQVWGRHHPTA
jgi:hypothetical protein